MGSDPDGETRPLAGTRGSLEKAIETAMSSIAQVHLAREIALPLCRQVIRESSLSIRAVHRGFAEDAQRHAGEAEKILRQAQGALQVHPELAASGFLHDAEKEYAEARLTAAMVNREATEGPDVMQVGNAAWLNGLAEAASELRRNLLDRLRDGDSETATSLLAAMEDSYDALVGVDYPDAITGGLRRSVDALRAVLERSRSDVTTTLAQERLRKAIESAGS